MHCDTNLRDPKGVMPLFFAGSGCEEGGEALPLTNHVILIPCVAGLSEAAHQRGCCEGQWGGVRQKQLLPEGALHKRTVRTEAPFAKTEHASCSRHVCWSRAQAYTCMSYACGSVLSTHLRIDLDACHTNADPKSTHMPTLAPQPILP
eukprot:1140566-Pelagomonas_calceolata.AAC.3